MDIVFNGSNVSANGCISLTLSKRCYRTNCWNSKINVSPEFNMWLVQRSQSCLFIAVLFYIGAENKVKNKNNSIFVNDTSF